MAAPKKVNLKGEGGVVWEFELPLSETYADQVKNRKLEPADDESAALLHDLLNVVDGDDGAGDEGDAAQEKPLERMKLAELLELAKESGVDSDTVAELEKPGTSKASVIEAIVAAREKE